MGRSSSLGPVPSDSLGVTPPPERRSRSGLGLRDRFSRLINRGESSETGAAIVKATEVVVTGTKVGSEAAASRLSVNTHSRAISTASLPRISAVGIPGPIQADNTLRHGVSPGASRIETTPGATLSSGNVDNTQIHANAAVPNRPLLAISALGPIEAGDSAAFEVTIFNVGSAPTDTSATGIQSNHHNLPLEQTQRQTSVEPDASGAAGASKSTWVTDKLVSPYY